VFILDLAAKIDQCAEYICKQQWGDLEFPPPFGREAFPEVIVKTSVYFNVAAKKLFIILCSSCTLTHKHFCGFEWIWLSS